jgi:hypothetical protein
MFTSTPPMRCSDVISVATAVALIVVSIACSEVESRYPPTCLSDTGDGIPPPEPLSRAPFQRGISIGLYSEDPDWSYADAFEEMRRLGATHTAIAVPWYIATARDVDVFAHPRYTVPLSTVERAMDDARKSGLEIFLFPYLYVEDKSRGGWRGKLAPRDLDAFFSSYSEFILRFAHIAEEHMAPLLSIGSELGSLEKHEGRWRDLASRVREIYGGELVYSANWDHYQSVPFVDALDYAGVSGYFELVDKRSDPPDEPDMERLVHSWREQHLRLMRMSRRAEKPLILTEVGYRSQRGAAARPWHDSCDAGVDLEVQRRCYEAVRRVWAKEPRLAGIYFWNWYGIGGPEDTDYTPRGKPAAKEIARWYGGLLEYR